jgi:hypothetical protein
MCSKKKDRKNRNSHVYNYLEYSYHQVGDEVKKKDAIEDIYAKLKIDSGELDAVPLIFNGTYNLKDLYPERTVFGVNEVIIHSYTMGCYYVKKGDIAQVEAYLEIMEQLFPEHPAVEDLRDKMGLAWLRSNLEKIVAVKKQPRKKKRGAENLGKHGAQK